jgi:hypothetical protein
MRHTRYAQARLRVMSRELDTALSRRGEELDQEADAALNRYVESAWGQFEVCRLMFCAALHAELDRN